METKLLLTPQQGFYSVYLITERVPLTVKFSNNTLKSNAFCLKTNIKYGVGKSKTNVVRPDGTCLRLTRKKDLWSLFQAAYVHNYTATSLHNDIIQGFSHRWSCRVTKRGYPDCKFSSSSVLPRGTKSREYSRFSGDARVRSWHTDLCNPRQTI